MPDGETTETVSREAFDRVKHDNETLKATVNEMRPIVEQFHLIDTAYEHFKGKGTVKDPYGVARSAARDSMFVGVEKDELPTRLDSWLESVQSVFGTSPPADDDSQTTPTATAPPPGAARPAPSPAGSGGEVKPEPLPASDPKIRKMIAEGRKNEVVEMMKRGEVVLSPQNPMNARVGGQ